MNEDRQAFLSRVMQQATNVDIDNGASPGEPIQWAIRERQDWGQIKGFNRDWSTVQKDWAIVKSHELSDIFSIAVIGHQGWSSLGDDTVPYALVVSFEAVNEDVAVYSLVSVANEVTVLQRAFGH